MNKYLQIVLALIILPLGLTISYISALKLPLEIRTPYRIFPFLEGDSISGSSPSFLFYHTLMAIILVLLTTLEVCLIACDSKYQSSIRFFRVRVLHPVFCLLLLTNFTRLGDLPLKYAILVNLAGIILTTLTRNIPFLYFFILGFPALGELGMLVFAYGQCLLDVLSGNWAAMVIFSSFWKIPECTFLGKF